MKKGCIFAVAILLLLGLGFCGYYCSTATLPPAGPGFKKR